MKRTPILSLALASLLLTGAAFADDFGFDFGDDGGFDFGDGGENASAGGLGAVVSAISWSGDANLESRLYVDEHEYTADGTRGDRYDAEDFSTAVFPSFKLGIDYSGASTDFSAKIKLDTFSLGDYHWDILDEFTARVYANNNLQLEVGKMRVVWGKGDKLHVLDNFNANDYTDYIIPDYIDRRIAEPMFRAVYTTNGGIKFEGIYTPTMTADRLASDGKWVPAAVQKLSKTLTSTIMAYAATTYNTTLNIAGATYLSKANSIANDPTSLYPNTHKLKYSQAGLRSTFTVGHVDLGASYYYGHAKTATADYTALAHIADLDYMQANLLHYDTLQVFGLEAATVLWRFNTRAEVAYNLTEDTAGDDPWVKNNSIGWVVGFDIDLPIHNINLNVQNQGNYILHNNKIDDGDGLTATQKSGGLTDFEYDEKGRYTNNKLVVAITDSWDHEKTKIDLKGIWGIERGDLIILPKITRTLFDGFALSLSGMYLWCKDDYSEFKTWEDNSFVSLSAKYQF